ncbi:MAG: hypothetical protein KDB62_10090 [Solirubrobacterales bacterium]|nr:hypothetical protein [Solirubrobacterales bacterium]
MAALVAISATAVVGCGGSDDDTEPARDRSAEISRLEKKVEKLQDEARQEQAGTAGSGSGSSSGDRAGSPAIGKMLKRLPGTAGLVVAAPGGDGPRVGGGDFKTGPAWSTIKVPIAERVLADAGGPGAISSAQRDQIRQAITVSDNDAAAALFADLEAAHGGLNGASRAVQQMLRQAGDSETVVSTEGRDGFSTYGQTDWSLAEQNRYMAALAGGCVSDPASRKLLLDDMAAVTAEPWGLGAAGVPARWKGGWGPGTDGRYLVRQMGVLELDGTEMVVTLAAIPDDGSFESAQAMATRIASWAAANLADGVGGSTAC